MPERTLTIAAGMVARLVDVAVRCGVDRLVLLQEVHLEGKRARRAPARCSGARRSLGTAQLALAIPAAGRGETLPDSGRAACACGRASSHFTSFKSFTNTV